MADKKISQLTALSAANLAPSTDVLAIVDTSATETKKIVAQDLVNGVLNVASAVGIGTSSPSTYGKFAVVGSGTTEGLAVNTSTTGQASWFSQNDAGTRLGVFTYGSTQAAYGAINSGEGAVYSNRSFTLMSDLAAGVIKFAVGGNTEAMRLTSTGLGIGTSSPTTKLMVVGETNSLYMDVGGPNRPLRFTSFATTADNAGHLIDATSSSGVLAFGTNQIERARITSGGDFLVGKQAVDSSVAGCEVQSTGQYVGVRNGLLALFNRLTTDGDLISFRQDGTEEGSISVSGNTVSYNAFAGSHWSQLQDGSKPNILRGTVMESINELCVWPGENNERLPKAKISDTAGSKKVYGVFMAWDNDWTTTNDMYVTAVGAFICRVNGSVTVQEGDLLESNGDGTARVQADDIIRSSTIGKVTSTVKTHQYADGSYCVPTVLYCG